jgi:mono/diheme cytochrome c family protein
VPALAESTHTSPDSASARASQRAADSARVAGRRAGKRATQGASAGADSGLTQLELGATVFQTHCARCHGPDGRGDGPGVYTLDVKPQNFHDAEYMATRTDEDLLISIRHGKDMAAMPRWDSILSEEEIHAVLAYVRTFATRP